MKQQPISHTKNLTVMMALGAASVLTACAAAPREVITTAVGPQPKAAGPYQPEGCLVVCSALAPMNMVDADYELHSSYTLYDAQGKTLKRIQNHLGSNDQDPTPVYLPAGRYQVSARGSGYRLITVPVVVRQHETTTVYLDGTGDALARKAHAQDVVRTRDGEIIGWREAQPAK